MPSPDPPTRATLLERLRATIECKAEKTITLGAYADEVKTQTTNAGAQIGAAVVKRRNRGPADAYVIMSLEQFAAILADADVRSLSASKAS